MSRLEKDFQAKLIKTLYEMFDGCLVLKNDSDYIQGIPDLLILYKNRWAALECKRGEKSSHRPNQDFYVDKMNKMSFARFIYPENKEQVLYELQRAFKSRRATRVPRRKSIPLDQLQRRKIRTGVHSMAGQRKRDKVA